MSKEAMKLALAALGWYDRETHQRAINALREALAEQPAQTDWEAVAADQAMTIAMLKVDLQEFAEKQADAVEVALTESGWVWDGDQWQRPAQRTWVGLTESEHTQIAIDAGCMSADWVFYGAAVERALKEKNT